MSATRRGSAFPTGSNSSSQSATIPASVQTGDFLIAVFATVATDLAGKSTPPTGWTYRGTTNSDNTSNFAQWVYTKTAAPGDASATVTKTNSGGATRCTMAVAAYYDNAGGTLDFESFIRDIDSTPGSSTTIASQAFGVAGGGVRNTGVETWTPPATWTEVGESHTDNGSGGKSGEIIESLTYVAGGSSIGGMTFSASAGTIGASWVMVVKNTPAASSNTTNFFQFLV